MSALNTPKPNQVALILDYEVVKDKQLSQTGESEKRSVSSKDHHAEK